MQSNALPFHSRFDGRIIDSIISYVDKDEANFYLDSLESKLFLNY
jgi:hypothetical protein